MQWTCIFDKNLYKTLMSSKLILDVFKKTRTSSSLICYKYDHDINLIFFRSLVINTCRCNVFIYDLVCNIKYFCKKMSLLKITILLTLVYKFQQYILIIYSHIIIIGKKIPEQVGYCIVSILKDSIKISVLSCYISDLFQSSF